jgi:hypothetical protein
MSPRACLRRTALALVGLGTVTSVALALADRQVRPHSAWRQDRYHAVAKYLRERSGPEARVLVWGNSPQIYLYAERRAATRYLSANYQTGRVWGTPANELGARPYRGEVPARAWDNLMADLERDPPLFIVDAAAGRLDKMDDEPIARQPRLAALVEQRYRPAAAVLGVPIYRRE